MDADGIGVDDEGTLAAAKGDEAELLLQPAEEQSDKDANDGTNERDETALEKEDVGDLAVGGTEVSQRHHVVALVDDEHRQRANDVEAGHHKNERKKNVADEFLNLHDAERVVLLLIAVEHGVAAVADAAHLGLHLLEVAARLEAEFERGDHALLVEDAAYKAYGGEEVALVVLPLLYLEDDSG